jgi:transposase
LTKRNTGCVKTRLRRERFWHPDLYFQQAYEYGEQAQVDFKESVVIPFKSGDLKCHLFVATLPASGVYFINAFPNMAFVAFSDGL